jgi:hypothetical protein
MRKLVATKSSQQFLPSEASYSKFYGVKLGLEKGVITRSRFDQGKFSIVSFNGFTNGNGWNYLSESTLEGTLENLLDGGFEVCEFDTFLEMTQWLSE